MNLNELKQTISFEWKIQTYAKDGKSASCCAFIDARDCMDALDRIVGPENWETDYKEIKGNLYGGVGIWDEKKKLFIYKWDCGIESQAAKEKGEASDAFKRACVKWGIGRFLYQLPTVWVKLNGPKSDSNKWPFAVDDNGNKIQDLTKHVNNFPQVKNAIEALKREHKIIIQLTETRYKDAEAGDEDNISIEEEAQIKINECLNLADLTNVYTAYNDKVTDKESFVAKCTKKKADLCAGEVVKK